MYKLGLVLLLHLCTAHERRFRRQTLPSQHIQVYSLQSNVLFDKYVTVVSSNSRVDLMEKEVNGSLWSAHSVVTFDSYDSFVNCSAQMAESYLNLNNASNIYAQGNDVNFSMRTNRTQDGHSSITHDLIGDTNISFSDNYVRVQAMNGQCASIDISTSLADREKSMTFTTTIPASGIRELILIATTSFCKIRICLVGATIFVDYSDKIVQINNNYSFITVYTDKYTITAKMNESTYDLSFTKEEILIRCPDESIMFRVLTSGVSVYVDQLSRLQIDRGGGEISLGGNILSAELIKVTSLSSELNFSNAGIVTVNTMNSEIIVQTPVQNVRMASTHHVIRIHGGTPHLITNSGEVCVEVKANHGLPHMDGIFSPFVTPVDRFANVGPDKAVLRTTTLPSAMSSSLPQTGLLGTTSTHFNETFLCALCANRSANVSTARLPANFTPTLPASANFTNVVSSTFPTLISHSITRTTITTKASSVPLSTMLSSSSSSVTRSSTIFALTTTQAHSETEKINIFYPMSVFPSTSSSTVEITESIQSNQTPDQFVIGQYGDKTSATYSSREAVQLHTSTISTVNSEMLSSSSIVITNPADSILASNVPFNRAISSSEFNDYTVVLPSSLPLANTDQNFNAPHGGGGSWETETLFPMKPPPKPTAKPSVLVLKMKMPSELNLNSFDLTRNLTSALSEVVRQSMLRVKRGKRSLPERYREYLVKVHQIERTGNSISVIFSINGTDVDSNIVENDLYSLDLDYLTRFLAFPVLSTISRRKADGCRNCIAIGVLSLLLSIGFLCVIFRSIVKDIVKTLAVNIKRSFLTCRLPERVTSITIITDETFTP